MPLASNETLAFLRNNDLKTILKRVRERDVPPLMQFAAYTFCGCLATVVFLGTVLTLNYTIIPAYEDMTVTTTPVQLLGRPVLWMAETVPGQSQPITHDAAGNAIRAANLLVNNCIAFILTNFVAYFSNILLVFKRGRHHPVFEFVYFTMVNFVSFAISQVAGPWLVSEFGVPTNVAILTNMVSSMLINFLARKFFVFKN
ncbi:MAG: GtrA family protein [Roseimicrobium sp.]